MQAITEVDDGEVQKAVAKHFFELHKFIAKELNAAQEERKLARVFSAELIAWVLIDIGLGYGVLEALRVPNQGEDRKGRSVRDVLDRLLVRRARRKQRPA